MRIKELMILLIDSTLQKLKSKCKLESDEINKILYLKHLWNLIKVYRIFIESKDSNQLKKLVFIELCHIIFADENTTIDNKHILKCLKGSRLNEIYTKANHGYEAEIELDDQLEILQIVDSSPNIPFLARQILERLYWHLDNFKAENPDLIAKVN